jgi:uncharacterized membrane protein YGL010W
MKTRSLNQWLSEYSVTHRHPINKKIHNICVPLIMLSTLGLLRSIPMPFESVWVRADLFFLAACWIFYFSLNKTVGAFMMALSLGMVMVNVRIESTGYLLPFSIALFIVTWIGQFIGHKIEGKKPSFFEDLVFLLIGPLWVFAPAYSRFISIGPK